MMFLKSMMSSTRSTIPLKLETMLQGSATKKRRMLQTSISSMQPKLYVWTLNSSGNALWIATNERAKIMKRSKIVF